jgi:hypothetical protein
MGVVHARVVDDFQDVRNVQISENGNAIWIHIFSKFQQKPNDASSENNPKAQHGGSTTQSKNVEKWEESCPGRF